ncbi:MAG TPA: HWE histidine kinase domain-containing protein [Rhizomicrobium sp.]|jgi:PAS domain S-box-containing protein|nr:HWE histidine kinase domain-containing protein [Rhizomicrobium sp.]
MKNTEGARAQSEFRLSAVLTRRSVGSRVLILLGALGIATAVRLFFGLFITGAYFAFYFPAIMVITVLAGWETGVAALLVSIMLGVSLFMQQPGSWPTQAQLLIIGVYMAASTFQIAFAQWLRQTMERLDESEARFRQLVSVTSGIVWATDGDGEVHMPQNGWSETTGVEWPAYKGSGWLDSVHESDRKGAIPVMSRIGAQGFYQAEFRLRDAKANDWRWFGLRAVPILDRHKRVRAWIGTLTDIHTRKHARELREIVIGELRHRLKNLFTVISSLAQSSKPPNEPAVDAFLSKLIGRLHALNAAADLVMVDWRTTIEIRAMVEATLAPFMADEARIEIEGPSLELSEETGGALALAIHELATNALKYGALSAPNGNVAIKWACEPSARGEEFILTWKEMGGPQPVKPTQVGFGTRVVQFAVSREKEGQVTLDYQPDGLFCRIAFLRTKAKPPELPLEVLDEL